VIFRNGQEIWIEFEKFLTISRAGNYRFCIAKGGDARKWSLDHQKSFRTIPPPDVKKIEYTGVSNRCKTVSGQAALEILDLAGEEGAFSGVPIFASRRISFKTRHTDVFLLAFLWFTNFTFRRDTVLYFLARATGSESKRPSHYLIAGSAAQRTVRFQILSLSAS
jgi:hypothetical protein